MARKIGFIALCFMLVFLLLVSSGSADVLSTEERYHIALTHLNAFMGQSPDVDLDTVIQEFYDLGSYKESTSFLFYAEVMKLVNTLDSDEKLLQGYLNAISQDEMIAEAMASDTFRQNYPYIREIDSMVDYVAARYSEQTWYSTADLGSLESALTLYQDCLGFYDAGVRYSALLRTSVTITATPDPVPETVPEPLPDDSVNVPVFSGTYPGFEARVRGSSEEGYRIYSKVGPGNDFVPTGGYKPGKLRKVTVYFEEAGFVLADVLYQSVEERFVYLPAYGFESIGNIPSVSSLDSFDGVASDRIVPSWGPDNRFNSVNALAVEAGTPIKVFFQENGFVYGEYTCGKGTVRMWLPADHIDLADANVTCSDVPIVPAGESSYY